MAITTKRMERPTQHVSYIRATLKGMAMTLKHLIDPHKVTTQYPEQKWPLSPRWRGTHRMLTTEDGKAKCVACGLCPTVCPANCIKLIPGEDEQGNRYPLVFEIDEFRCIFCGYCQEVCPEAAIYVMLDAQFIGAIQVLVYAGAIMVVFLFVIMLLNLGHPSELADARGIGWKLAAGAAGLALLA